MAQMTPSPEHVEIKPTEHVELKSAERNPLIALQNVVDDLIEAGVMSATLRHYDYVVEIKITHRINL